MHKRTKKTMIPMSVKYAVLERDCGLCVICGKQGDPSAHYISRAHGGLGIEQNIITLCRDCHRDYDGAKRTVYKRLLKAYLESQYPEFPDEKRIYRKYGEAT